MAGTRAGTRAASARAGARPKAAGRGGGGARSHTRAGRGRLAARLERWRPTGRPPDEAWGALLVVGGLVAALGTYADLTGPVGRGLRTAAGLLVGTARVVLPVVLVGLGLALLLGGEPEDRRPGRLLAGSGLVVVAFVGLLDLGHHHLGVGASSARLEHAGGFLGAAVAGPLHAVLATWGTAVVLVALAVVGVLLASRTRPRHGAAVVVGAAAAVGRAARATAHLAADWMVGCFDRPPSSDGPTVIDAASAGWFDELDAPVPEVARAPGVERADPVVDVRARPHDAVPGFDRTRAGEQLSIQLDVGGDGGGWRLPPAGTLKRTKSAEVDRRPIEDGGRILERALHDHGVDTRLIGMTVGPTVARYELELGPGVKVARVTSLSKDIAYAMAAEDVRILAPIPGKSAIGVEVPNRQRQLVSLGDILAGEDARRATHPLEVAVGRDINGRGVMANLAEMPHILIAGATGAGKSSCINSIITSVLMRATPEQVRMILVDPKRVELGQYEGVPHLLTQVVTNPKRAANALSWVVAEMERRYDLLHEVGVRDITGYNAAFDRGELLPPPPLLSTDVVPEYHRLPFILVVVDELNDLMMVAARDVEESICRIAQMARAVGIHLVIATQRPSVDVITGVIKANVPSRLAFKVSSLADSRVILDQQGAEKLVGKGDMLLLTANTSVSRRIQGCWVSEEEVRRVVAHWRRQADPVYVEGVEGGGDDLGGYGGGVSADDDELLAEAMDLVVRSQLGSTSMLQRKLKVGFSRAGRLMDLLERSGVVGPSEGSKARAVLMTVDELDALQSRGR
jgi:S-DNA-T family DNA segregation ATPase FtsK/SpoIIIE